MNFSRYYREAFDPNIKKITVYGKSANNFMRQNHREVFEK